MHVWEAQLVVETMMQAQPPPAVSVTPLPDELLTRWRSQLAAHDGTQPLWLPRSLLRPGTLVADTLNLHAPDAAVAALADAAGCDMGSAAETDVLDASPLRLRRGVCS